MTDVQGVLKGTNDQFYQQKQLLPENFVEAAQSYDNIETKEERKVNLRLQPVCTLYFSSTLLFFELIPFLFDPIHAATDLWIGSFIHPFIHLSSFFIPPLPLKVTIDGMK